MSARHIRALSRQFPLGLQHDRRPIFVKSLVALFWRHRISPTGTRKAVAGDFLVDESGSGKFARIFDEPWQATPNKRVLTGLWWRGLQGRRNATASRGGTGRAGHMSAPTNQRFRQKQPRTTLCDLHNEPRPSVCPNWGGSEEFVIFYTVTSMPNGGETARQFGYTVICEHFHKALKNNA